MLCNIFIYKNMGHNCLIISLVLALLLPLIYGCRPSGENDGNSGDREGQEVVAPTQCISVSDGGFYRCGEFLNYSCTPETSFQSFNVTVKNGNSNVLYNISLALLEGNCNCSYRAMEFYCRLAIPACGSSETECTNSSNIVLPCADYCYEFLDGCLNGTNGSVENRLVKIISENATGFRSICDYLNGTANPSNCWRNMEPLRDCTGQFPIPTTTAEITTTTADETTPIMVTTVPQVANNTEERESLPGESNRDTIIIACSVVAGFLLVAFVGLVIFKCTRQERGKHKATPIPNNQEPEDTYNVLYKPADGQNDIADVTYDVTTQQIGLNNRGKTNNTVDYRMATDENQITDVYSQVHK